MRGDCVTVSAAYDELNDRQVFVAFHEKKKIFLRSVTGCFLARNWTRNIRRAALWRDGEIAAEILSEKGFKIQREFDL